MEQGGCDPYMATGRQRHYASQAEGRSRPSPPKPAWQRKCSRPRGALYARRKVIVAPVFGQIKEARGFRRCLLRGLQKIRGVWGSDP